MYLLFLACVLIEPPLPSSQALPIAKAEAPPAKEGCSCSKGCVCTFPACQCIDNFGEPQRCDNAKCGCAQRPKKAEHAYRWVRGDSLDQIHLYDGKTQVGTFRYSGHIVVNGKEEWWGLYYPFDGENWAKHPLPYGRIPSGAPEPPAKLKRPNSVGHPQELPIPSQSFAPVFHVRSC